MVPEKVTEDNGTAALDAGISIDTSAIIRPVDPGIILHSRYAHDRNGNLTYDMELQTDFAYNSLNLLEKAMRNDTIVAKYYVTPFGFGRNFAGFEKRLCAYSKKSLWCGRSSGWPASSSIGTATTA